MINQPSGCGQSTTSFTNTKSADDEIYMKLLIILVPWRDVCCKFNFQTKFVAEQFGEYLQKILSSFVIIVWFVEGRK